MNDFHTIYYNKVGIAFQLKRAVDGDFSKVMIIYKKQFIAFTKGELLDLTTMVTQLISNNPIGEESQNQLYLLKYHPNFKSLFEDPSEHDLDDLLEFLNGTLKQIEFVNSCDISQDWLPQKKLNN